MSFRMKRFHLFLALIIMSIIQLESFAQGISRSTGLGVRVGFWNITGQPTRIHISGDQGKAYVDLSGVGAYLHFFSRAHNNLFFEMNLGAIGSVQSEADENLETNVDIEALVPLLFGLRYHLFGTRLSGAFHPYISIGGGPYWATSVKSSNNIMSTNVTIASQLDYGGYLGGC